MYVQSLKYSPSHKAHNQEVYYFLSWVCIKHTCRKWREGSHFTSKSSVMKSLQLHGSGWNGGAQAAGKWDKLPAFNSVHVGCLLVRQWG